MLFLEPLCDLLTKVEYKHVLGRPGEPPPRVLLPDKKILRFSRLVDSVIKKQAIIRTLPPPTTSGLKLGGFLYTPVCNARSEGHSIAHGRQTIVPFIRFRNLGSSMPGILIPSKYLPYIASAIWGARNLKVKSYMRSAISHVRPSPLAGTNLISMEWAHEPVPF